VDAKYQPGDTVLYFPTYGEVYEAVVHCDYDGSWYMKRKRIAGKFFYSIYIVWVGATGVPVERWIEEELVINLTR
jgi:ABC-type anion transport system duplicated permease subunit